MKDVGIVGETHSGESIVGQMNTMDSGANGEQAVDVFECIKESFKCGDGKPKFEVELKGLWTVCIKPIYPGLVDKVRETLDAVVVRGASDIARVDPMQRNVLLDACGEEDGGVIRKWVDMLTDKCVVGPQGRVVVSLVDGCPPAAE